MLSSVLTSCGIVVGVLIVIGLLVIGPYLSILAINQLFGTSIALTFWNWLSAFWLHLVVANTYKS